MGESLHNTSSGIPNIATDNNTGQPEGAYNRSGTITKITCLDNHLIICGICTVQLNRKAVLIATVGDVVGAIEIINQFDDSLNDTKTNTRFRISVSRTLLEESKQQLLTLKLFNGNASLIQVIPCESVLSAADASEHFLNVNVLQIFPSWGYFGGGRHTPLRIELNDTISSLRIKIEGKSSILNLAGLELLDEKGGIIAPSDNLQVSSSSVNDQKKSLMELLKGRGFHSVKEDNPWLEVKFKSNQYVSAIKITNRKDKWSVRAKNITVHTKTEHSPYKMVYSGASNNPNINSLTLAVSQHLTSSFMQRHHKNPETLRARLIDEISYRCEQNINKIEEYDVSFLEQLLSLWSPLKYEQLDQERELKLLALVVHQQTIAKIQIELRPYSQILPSGSSIKRLESLINELRDRDGLPQIQITKHGIAFANKLTGKAEVFADSIKTIVDDFTDLNLKPCLAYGTLLGAIRDKAFISHDDDVDLLVELPEEVSSPSEAFALMEDCISRLDKKKYKSTRASKSGKNLNFHVKVIKTNAVIDVFPYWVKDGNAMLHMEMMSIRSIPKEILSGRDSIDFYGHQFPIPVNSVAFLAERYGENWSTPDQFHEWPWPLKET